MFHKIISLKWTRLWDNHSANVARKCAHYIVRQFPLERKQANATVFKTLKFSNRLRYTLHLIVPVVQYHSFICFCLFVFFSPSHSYNYCPYYVIMFFSLARISEISEIQSELAELNCLIVITIERLVLFNVPLCVLYSCPVSQLSNNQTQLEQPRKRSTRSVPTVFELRGVRKFGPPVIAS